MKMVYQSLAVQSGKQLGLRSDLSTIRDQTWCISCNGCTGAMPASNFSLAKDNPKFLGKAFPLCHNLINKYVVINTETFIRHT
jgi:hypothetical protein